MKEIDDYEFASTTAIFNAVAQNTKKKNLKPKDIFDSDKARKQVLSVDSKPQEEIHLDRYKAMKEARARKKSNRPQNGKKGG